MRAPVLFRFLVPLVLIAGLGVFWADAVWWHKDSGVRAWVESIPLLDRTLEYLHFPAKVLFVASGYMRLGPSGDAGWVMLPICMIAQWATVGCFVGFWLARRYTRKQSIVRDSSS
jgi:hypothetical protein